MSLVIQKNCLGFLDFDLVDNHVEKVKFTEDDLQLALRCKCEKIVIEILIQELGESCCKNMLLCALQYGNSFEIIQLLIDHGALATGFCVCVARQESSKEIVRLVEETNKQQYSILESQYQKKDEEKQISTIGKKRKVISEIVFSRSPQRKYDYQFIFDARPKTGQAQALANKAIKKGIASPILPLYDNKLLNANLDRIVNCATHQSRGYLIAHCSPGSDCITGESMTGEKIRISLKVIADLFLKATLLKIPPVNGQRFKLCLVICDGASMFLHSGDYPGRQLSFAFYARKMEIEVVAYHGKIYVDALHSRKLVDGVHHKPKSKFSFITRDEGSFIKLVR